MKTKNIFIIFFFIRVGVYRYLTASVIEKEFNKKGERNLWERLFPATKMPKTSLKQNKKVGEEANYQSKTYGNKNVL